MDIKVICVIFGITLVNILDGVSTKDADMEASYKALGSLRLKKKYATDEYFLKKKNLNHKDLMLEDAAETKDPFDGSDAAASEGHLLVRKRRGWNLQYVNVKYTPAGGSSYANNRVFRRNYDVYNEIPRYNGRNLYGGHF